MNSHGQDQGQLKSISECVFVSVWCFWRGLIPNHNCCQQVHKCRRIIKQNDEVFHQMIVSFLLLTLFARVKVFEAQARIRSARPNPSSLLRQASLWEEQLWDHCDFQSGFYMMEVFILRKVLTWWKWCSGCAACSDFDQVLCLTF